MNSQMQDQPQPIEKALQFAARAHNGQLRNYTDEPYITHPIAVSRLVAEVTDDPRVIAAALLHDTLEDTPTSVEDLRREFGPLVAHYVACVTDVATPAHGNRAARKAIERVHIAAAPPQAKTIKLADMIDNIRSIQVRDPKFAKVYLKEKRALLEVLQEGDATLYHRARSIIDDYFAGA
jgi:(p)ppGpp synthase/HD superfamily hydrolase